MANATASGLLEVLTRHQLLKSAQLEELAREQEQHFADPKALAREIVRRGWLTVFQVNQVLQGKAGELVLGPYVLLERLGEGGMGAVFKARHRKLGRVVALKVIRKARMARPDAVKRFQREVQAVAQLAHPNIVLAYDADQIGDTHLLVMEYVEGTDLARLVQKQGPLPLEQACEYVRQAAQGLQHAHEKGMVHRDIKPHNLMLTRQGVVKVLDLGLARLRQAPEAALAANSMTQEGAVLGTPDYIAPEQALDTHAADIRADLYSLGCTLYFLLTGRPPFIGASMAEVLVKHQLQEPEPIQKLRPDVPETLRAVLAKLLTKKPEQRFQTPAEPLQALGASPARPNGAVVLPPPASDSSAQLGALAHAATLVDENTDDSLPRPDVLPVPAGCQPVATAASHRGPAPAPAAPGGRRRLPARVGRGLRDPAGAVPVAGRSRSSRGRSSHAAAPATVPEGPRYLADLPEIDALVGHGQFGKKGELGTDGHRIVVKGVSSPHGLGMHPPDYGFASVNYRLGRQYRVFQATAAINDSVGGTSTPLVFMVVGNGRTLWKSQPLQARGAAQDCRVVIAGVDRLELRVQCSGGNGSAHAVWVEPRVLK